MIKVHQSNHLNQSHYDKDSQTLTVQFVNGAVHQYKGVPPTVNDSLNQSPSPGSYFHSKIKDNYSSTKISEGARKGRRR